MESLQNLKVEYQQEIDRIARAVRDLGWTPGSDSDDIANAAIDSQWMRNPAAVLACCLRQSAEGCKYYPASSWEWSRSYDAGLTGVAIAAMIEDTWDRLEATEPMRIQNAERQHE